jgi:peptidoglycan hydrolase-like protein with peptidoglycan-binding domain
MKKQLLWSTAALLATIGLASAQGAQGDSVGGKASAAGEASSTVSGSSQGSQARPGHAKHEQAQGEGRNQVQGQSQKNQAQSQPERSKGHGQAQRSKENSQTSGEARDKSHEGKAKIKQAEDRNQRRKEKRETTGQAVGKSDQKGERSEAAKSGNKNQVETRDHRPQHDQTTGQGARQQGEATKQGAQSSQSQPHQQSQPGSGESGQAAQSRTGSATEAQSGGGARAQVQGASLTAEQQTKIQQTMLSSRNVHRLDNASFSVSVGTAVPTSVRLVEVPPAVVEIYPQWRGDSYVVVRDEIVIVDHSRKIVGVIPAGSSRADISAGSSRAGMGRADVVADLSDDDIREVQTVLIRGGFLEGEADGVFGPRTRQALIKFQRERGIQATGSIDMRTVATMNLSGKVNVQGATDGQSSTTGSGMHRRSGQQHERSNGQASPQPSHEPSTTGQGGGALNPSENNRAPPAQSTTGSGDHRQGKASAQQPPARSPENKNSSDAPSRR